MTDAYPRNVQFGDPLAQNAQEARKNSMAVALLGYGLGIPAALGILVSGGVITSYALTFAYSRPQWIMGLAVGIASTLCIAIMPVAAELNEKPNAKTLAWVVFFTCLALGMIACVAYGITAPTGTSSPSFARPMSGDLSAMKARLADLDIDARPENRIIQDLECYRLRNCNRRPLYRPDRLEDELEARRIEDAIGHRRLQTAQTQSSYGSFLATAYKSSANGLNWALPLLGLLICASVIAVLAGAIAPLMTGLTQNPVSPASSGIPASSITPVTSLALDEIQQMFDIWKERLQWGSALSTRAQVLYDDFRNTCLKAGKPCWTSSDGKTPPRFGEAMAPLLRLKRASVDTSNGTVYKGVALPGAQS